MNVSQLKKMKLPDSPGVYLFRDGRGRILYIGKATSLRDRVRSYFGADLHRTRGPLLVEMIERARVVDFKTADSVLEALILEASLIKRHRPVYNTRDKDDKSYNYLVITREEYPRVLVARGKDLDETFPARKLKYVFGPFPQGGLLREAVKIVRKIFPFRDTCEPTRAGQHGVPCFNEQLGLCPGVCEGRMTAAAYGRTIRHIRLLFEGKKPALLTALKREMRAAARAEHFEEAGVLKRQIFALTHIADVTLLKKEIADLPRARNIFRIEAYDIAHTAGADTVGAMVVVESGEARKAGYRKFRIRGVTAGNDIAALKEVLARRLAHTEWRLPNLMAMDGGAAQLRAASEVLAEHGYRIPVVSIVKDEYHRPREILGARELAHEHEGALLLANAEAHRFAMGYHKKRRSEHFLP